MKKEKRNGYVSLWKFIFACVIVLFHCSSLYPNWNNFFVKGGYIAVEYFFIITGFYMTKKALKKSTKNIGKETIEYVWKLIKKLIPFLVIAYVISISSKIIFESHKTYEWINSIWNLLLLRQVGFQSLSFNNHLWYLTSLIIGILITYPALKKYKENFIYIASPLIVMFGLGYLSKTFGGRGLDQALHVWDKIWYTGTIRAIIELNIGCIIYLINKNLKKIEYTKLGKILFTIAGNGLLVLVILMIQLLDNSRNYDYIMLLFITIAITIIVSDKTLDIKLLSNKIIYYLEKLSMPMYINHIFIIYIMERINFPDNIPLLIISIFTLIITILFCVLEIKIIEMPIWEKIKNKIKLLIIEKV